MVVAAMSALTFFVFVFVCVKLFCFVCDWFGFGNCELMEMDSKRIFYLKNYVKYASKV
jgi:hypothetical protein